MKEFIGISASPGIAIGPAFLYMDDTLKVPEYTVTEEECPAEFSRFLVALKKATDEIEALQKQSGSMGEEGSKLLDSHILMLSDPEFVNKVKESLFLQCKNVEWILLQTVKELIHSLESSKDPYLRERTVDIHDVARRVMNHLLYRESISLSDLPSEVILVTHSLLPSDAIAMDKQKVKGIAMNAGGKTSHTAILARAFGIPAVLGLSEITRFVRSGDEIVLDGNAGKVIVNPDKHTREQYQKLMHVWQKREVGLLSLNQLAAETRDGKRVFLEANIEVPEETDSVLAHGADGIGLFRSEFLFLKPGRVFSLEEQYEAYSTVVEAMRGKPVTIRTLDVGGDKAISEINDVHERNPLLGWRAVRFCLERKDIFRVQLKAILMASMHGNVRIMFPMISGAEELDEILAFLEEVKEECRHEGVSFKEDIPVGIMIEVPSAAMTSDILAKKVNFFSIGTNDLIQYTIAVDRGNEKIAYLYEPFHPSVLRLIKLTIDNAHAAGITVSMCGEMAGDTTATVVLLGFGLDTFSMSSMGIPEIKQIIRSVKKSDAEELAQKVLGMSSYREIETYIEGWMNERIRGKKRQ